MRESAWVSITLFEVLPLKNMYGIGGHSTEEEEVVTRRQFRDWEECVGNILLIAFDT